MHSCGTDVLWSGSCRHTCMRPTTKQEHVCTALCRQLDKSRPVSGIKTCNTCFNCDTTLMGSGGVFFYRTGPWQKHSCRWLHEFHCATTMTLGGPSLPPHKVTPAPVCIIPLEDNIAYLTKWNSSTWGQTGFCGKQISRLGKALDIDSRNKLLCVCL